MTAKPPTPDEFRMKADEFDKMMRGALSAHPPKVNPKPRRPAKPRRATAKVSAPK
jgi:hypothetical protein